MAQLYLNHRAVGQGIAAAVARGVPRKEIFLVTKVNPRFYSGAAIDELIPKFLEELQVDYLDLVLLHHPQGIGGVVGTCPRGTPRECRANAWSKLSAMRDAGLIRNLGVSNHRIHQIAELQALRLAPVTANQIQYNPWAPDWQHEVVRWCQKNGVVVTAWSPFQGTMMQHAQAFTVSTLTKIAADKGKTVPQVMLRWAVQKGVSAIPGTGNPAHMDENLGVFGFSLSGKEMALIDSLGSDEKAAEFAAVGFEKNES